MRPGALIDYRMRLHGIPLGWRTRIAEWDPPHRFVDEQLRGPYRLWWHEHEFESLSGGERTLVRDRVTYRMPFPRLARRFVERDLRAIFAYRHARLLERFPRR